MLITPDTNIILLKVPLTIDNKNQLTFTNAEEQFNYFYNLPKLQIEGCSYIRKDNTIRFPAQFDEVINYNYCMYQNENYNTKWFYAYIVDMKYINDGRTDIVIDTDVWQTWQFDISFHSSFVAREMINVEEDIPRCQFIT